MSFWDNVKKFAQPYADDDYDEYDEDDEYLDEEYDEAPAPRRAPRAAAPRRNPVSAPVEEDLDEEYEDDDYGFDDEEAYEEGFDFGDEDSIIYEVKCACGNVINFDEENLEEGSIICPDCGETLEFSFEDEDEEDAEF